MKAQNEADTISNNKCDSLVSLKWVLDSSFRSLRTEKFKSIKVFFPSYKEYKKFTDTSAAGKQSECTQFIMYNTFWNTLRIQHTKLMKKCKKSGIKLDKTTLDSVYFNQGFDKGLDFAYLHWVVKYNKKKKYLIKAVSLKINGSWYILDELKFIGLIKKEKKKKAPKRPLRTYDL